MNFKVLPDSLNFSSSLSTFSHIPQLQESLKNVTESMEYLFTRLKTMNVGNVKEEPLVKMIEVRLAKTGFNDDVTIKKLSRTKRGKESGRKLR